MLHTLQYDCLESTRPGHKSPNHGVILSLLMVLSLAPITASAAPTSALLKSTMPDSSGKPAPASSEINPAALTEEIKKKLATTRAELALLPPEAVTGSSASGQSGEVDIFARRLHLKQLVFIYQGQLARLASLQVHQQHRLGLENQAANWSGFSEPSLHPFLRADELKESIANLTRRMDELKTWIPEIDESGVELINIAENTTIKLRQADEAVEQAKESPEQQARLERERDLVKLQNQIDLARSMSFQIENQDVHRVSGNPGNVAIGS
jgi:hypothetical protein